MTKALPQANEMSSLTLTQLAARRLEEMREIELTVDVQEKAIACLIDCLGALISGLSAPWSNALLEYAKVPCPRRGGSHVMGLDTEVPAETAAFVHATVAHSLIRDDMHLGAGAHIGVMVIPAALALAQRDNWSGNTLLKAIVAGYDMAVALGTAVRSSGSCNPHFRPSGIVGAFAAAAVGVAADKRINIATSSSALGLGANMAAGLNEWPWAGGMEINTQMGTASRSGIAALDLASAGISSSETVLEGRDGLFAAYGCGPGSVEVFRQWLTSSAIGTGILGAKFKPIAGCNFIQTPVAVAIKLSERITGRIDQVEKILIVTTKAAKMYPGCDNCGPFDKVQQTKMSLQYAVASALRFGRVDEAIYRRFDDLTLQDLIRKSSIETDSAYDQELVKGKQPCRIEINFKADGGFQDSLPDVPWLETNAVTKRCRSEAAVGFSPEQIDGIMSECELLPRRASCDSLFEMLKFYKADTL